MTKLCIFFLNLFILVIFTCSAQAESPCSYYDIDLYTGLEKSLNANSLINKKDSHGRVIQQTLNEGDTLATYFYNKQTTEVIYHFFGIREIYRFDESGNILNVEIYTQDCEKTDSWVLVTKEDRSYQKDNRGKIHLCLRTLEDNSGEILFEHLLDRKQDGKLLEETLINHIDTSVETQVFAGNEKQNLFAKRMNSFPFDVPAGKGGAIADGLVIYEKFDSIGKAFLGDTLFRWACHTEVPRTGVHGNAKEQDNIRITYINGILNHEAELQESLQLISKGHSKNVHYVYRGTQSWNNDNALCILVKYGYVSDHARRLATLWKKLLAEIGEEGQIIHYAHSIGGAETACAKTLLTPEEQKKITVIVFGSPVSIRSDEGFAKSINYVHKRDIIPYLSLDTLRALVDSESYPHIAFIGHLAEFALEHDFCTYWFYWQDNAEKDMGLRIIRQNY